MVRLLAIVFLALLATPLAHASSAGSYGTGANTVKVETKLTATPVHTTLSVRLKKGNETTPWTPVVADASGDGQDVESSPEISVGGDTYRWKDGKLQKKTPNGWVRQRKPPKGNGTCAGAWTAPGNNIGTVPYWL